MNKSHFLTTGNFDRYMFDLFMVLAMMKTVKVTWGDVQLFNLQC
jgi:hypothetical protein